MENKESQAVLTMSRTPLPATESVLPSNAIPRLSIALSASGVRQAPLPEISAEIVRRGKEIYQQIRATGA